jgi:hypothetical protein
MSRARTVLTVALFLVALSLPWSSYTTTTSTLSPGYSVPFCSLGYDGYSSCTYDIVPGTFSFWSNTNTVIGREGGARFILVAGIVAAVIAYRRGRGFTVTSMAIALPFLFNESGFDLIRGGALAALVGMAFLTDWTTRPKALRRRARPDHPQESDAIGLSV